MLRSDTKIIRAHHLDEPGGETMKEKTKVKRVKESGSYRYQSKDNSFMHDHGPFFSSNRP